MISIITPVFNALDFIDNTIAMVLRQTYSDWEWIIVEDGSTDGTREILETEVKPIVSKIVYHEKNAGKGAALRTGFAHATGDVVIIQDADLEYDPMDYAKVVTPIFAGKAKVVYGSRFLRKQEKGYLANYLANRFLTLLSNLFTRQHLTDMETCYKAFRRDVIQSVTIEEERFGFEPEITAKISKKRIRIHEVPISYHPRTTKEGKKIGFRDGLRAIYCIWRYR